MDYKDYYKILGISKGAGKDEIRSSFRKLARQYHPDVAGNDPKAEEKFKEVSVLYGVRVRHSVQNESFYSYVLYCIAA